MYQQALDEVQQELDDVKVAKIRASQLGKGLGDYDLPTAAAMVRQERIAMEKVAQQEQAYQQQQQIAPLAQPGQQGTISGSPRGPLGFSTPQDGGGKVMIGGEEAEGASVTPNQEQGTDEVVTKGEEGGPIQRLDVTREQILETLAKGTEGRNPFESIQLVNTIKEGVEGLSVTKTFKYTPDMKDKYPEVKRYVDQYGAPKEVVQVEDKNSMVNDRPASFVIVNPNKGDVQKNYPKREDSVGKDINPTLHWSYRFDKATGQKSGTTYKRMQAGESYREIMGLPAQ